MGLVRSTSFTFTTRTFKSGAFWFKEFKEAVYAIFTLQLF
jgi:hypothetical protein